MITSRFSCLTLFFLLALTAQAKDVKDTLYSSGGDRIIVNYSIVQNGGQVSVRFQGVHKKLGQKHQGKSITETAVELYNSEEKVPDKSRFDNSKGGVKISFE